MKTNYKKMSDDALQAALNANETSTDEKMAIQAEIQKRLAKQAAAGVTNETPSKTLEEKIEEMKAFVAHKCQVLCTNISTDWLEGVITGVNKNTKMGTAYFSIKLESGKIVTKVYGSNTIKISDEVVEIKKASRARVAKEPWTPEVLTELVRKYSAKVGAMLTKSDGTVGRIISIVPDKRSQSILFKLKVVNEEGVASTAFCVANSASTGYTIAEDFDEEGDAINEKYISRFEKAAAKKAVTPEEKLAAATADLEKAVAALEKAQALVETKRTALAKLQDELMKGSEAGRANDPGDAEAAE